MVRILEHQEIHLSTYIGFIVVSVFVNEASPKELSENSIALCNFKQIKVTLPGIRFHTKIRN